MVRDLNCAPNLKQIAVLKESLMRMPLICNGVVEQQAHLTLLNIVSSVLSNKDSESQQLKKLQFLVTKLSINRKTSLQQMLSSLISHIETTQIRTGTLTEVDIKNLVQVQALAPSVAPRAPKVITKSLSLPLVKREKNGDGEEPIKAMRVHKIDTTLALRPKSLPRQSKSPVRLFSDRVGEVRKAEKLKQHASMILRSIQDHDFKSFKVLPV